MFHRRGVVVSLLVNQIFIFFLVSDNVHRAVALLGTILIIMHAIPPLMLCTWPFLWGSLQDDVWNIVAINSALTMGLCLYEIMTIYMPPTHNK